MKDSSTLSVAKIFWASVDKTNDCWLWQGSLDYQGYGRLRFHKYTVKAHRVSYELAFGSIPDGKVVCHKCDNPTCVKPDHLFLGDPADNVIDAQKKGRMASHDKNGRAKLTAAQVDKIRNIQGLTQQAIAHKFGVAQTTISAIRRGANWK